MTFHQDPDICPAVFEFLQYLEVQRNYTSATLQQYYLDLRRFFLFLLSQDREDTTEPLVKKPADIDQMFLQEITSQEVSSYLLWLAVEKQLQERTRNRRLATLKSFFRYLEEENQIKTNILRSFRPTKTKQTLPFYLEEPQIYALLDTVSGTFALRDRCLLLFMVSSGLRVSEVVSLTLSSVQGGQIRVLGKGNKERQVPLSDCTSHSLESYLKEQKSKFSRFSSDSCDSGHPSTFITSTAPLFLSRRNTALSVRAVQAMVSKYAQEAQLQGVTCHKLRHTAATQLLHYGANLREIQRILGHENLNTTELYTHVTNKDLKQVMSLLKI